MKLFAHFFSSHKAIPIEPATEIPEIKLVPLPESEAAKAVLGFKVGPNIGNHHKIGGKPDWIQGPDDNIVCCGKEMTFYGQLDAIGDQFPLMDAGTIFVFVCLRCCKTKSILQST